MFLEMILVNLLNSSHYVKMFMMLLIKSYFQNVLGMKTHGENMSFSIRMFKGNKVFLGKSAFLINSS